MKDQSESRIDAQAAKSKRAKRAECDAMRPPCCPKCKTPSRPPGGGVQVQGHGERGHTQRGPRAIEQPPAEWSVGVRRYKCKKCGATVTVAPRGVVPRRLYPGRSIGLALTLYGLLKQSAVSVRKAIAPTASARDPAEAAPWSTLLRWAQEAKAGTLFVEGRACPAEFTLREAAERAATTLLALGKRGADAVGRVWEGALEAHWRGAS